MIPTELRVMKIFMNCLFKKGGDSSSSISIKSLMFESVLLDPERLNAHRQEIESMLDEIPPVLMKKSGWKGPCCGCKLRDGTDWACIPFLGDHLYTFGVALGRIDPEK